MQLVLLIAIATESILLLCLAAFKKLTRKQFLIISLATAVFCVMGAFLSLESVEPSNRNGKVRESVYAATKLLEENRPEEVLTVLNQISQAEGESYAVFPLRLAALKLSGDNVSIGILLDNSEDKVLSDELTGQLTSSQVKEFIENSRALLNLSPEESQRMDAEYLLRYGAESKNDSYRAIREAIESFDYETAFTLAMDKIESGTRADDILIAEMYVRNYNQHLLENNDPVFSQLLRTMTDAELDFYRIAQTNDPEKESYQQAYATYQLAKVEWNQENCSRAINFLNQSQISDEVSELAYQLQMAKLYAMYNECEQADACLDKVFTDLIDDPNQWLGTEVRLLREVFLNYSDSFSSPQFDAQYCRLMKSLYQGLLDESASGVFYNYLRSYLRSAAGEIFIGLPDLSNYPVVKVEVFTFGEVELNQTSLALTDTGERISEFKLEEKEAEEADYYLMYWLADSGPGELLKYNVRKTMNSFGLDSFGPLTSFNSLYSGFINLADRNRRNGSQTDCLLFHDGTAGTYPNGMPGVLNRFIADGIAINVVGCPGCDIELMRYLAYQTGGTFYFVSSLEELRAIKDELLGKFKHSYVLTYTVSSPAEVERSLSVTNLGTSFHTSRKYTTEPLTDQYRLTHDKQTSDFFKQIGGTLGGVK